MKKQLLSSKMETVGTRNAHVLRYIDSDGSRIAVYGLISGLKVTQNGETVPTNGSHETMYNEIVGKPVRAILNKLM